MQSIDWPQASPSSTGRAVWRASAARQLPGLPGGRGRQSSAPTTPDSTPIRPPGRASAAPRPGPRFIPARAGNTAPAAPGSAGPAVHPRSRREHGSSPRTTRRRRGSSPLAQGTQRGTQSGRLHFRFIPARAGNTGPWWRRSRAQPVHPRSRREHSVTVPLDDVGIGSSPLARGTLDRRPDSDGSVRFIPARAGNTVQPRRGGALVAVHPRSRGEHGAVHDRVLACIGSSPLARGTLTLRRVHAQPVRFIPARAGNTHAPPRPRSARTVHPRSRGEHLLVLLAVFGAAGSSPLARGTLGKGAADVTSQRFIPARAGNT